MMSLKVVVCVLTGVKEGWWDHIGFTQTYHGDS